MIDSGLAEQIITFDKRNMQPILEKAGIEFPEDKRQKGLPQATFIIAFNNNEIAGYLEYLRSWNDPNLIYVGSIQIAEKYRNTKLILELLDEFRRAVSSEQLDGFETSVQKTNTTAAKMYQKIGFKLEENPNNAASWLAKAGKDLLENSPVIRLIDKWRKKNQKL